MRSAHLFPSPGSRLRDGFHVDQEKIRSSVPSVCRPQTAAHSQGIAQFRLLKIQTEFVPLPDRIVSPLPECCGSISKPTFLDLARIRPISLSLPRDRTRRSNRV